LDLSPQYVSLMAIEYAGDDREAVVDKHVAPSRILVNCTTMNDDRIPDVRDGLTREQRVVLYVLHQLQQERGDASVPTPMLWGRVCEYFYISPEALSAMLAQLGARK
jgi:hypothetical protein